VLGDADNLASLLKQQFSGIKRASLQIEAALFSRILRTSALARSESIPLSRNTYTPNLIAAGVPPRAWAQWTERIGFSRHIVRSCRRRAARNISKAFVARWAAIARRPAALAALGSRRRRRAAAAALARLRAAIVLTARRRGAARRVAAFAALRRGRKTFRAWQR
jgi:hypothetical protein